MSLTPRPALPAAVLIAALTSLLTGCILATDIRQRSDPDPKLVAAALEHGEWDLPPGATAVAVSYTRWQDDSFSLTVVMPPDGVDAFLSGSRFTEPLHPGNDVPYDNADGSPRVDGPATSSAQESLPGPPARPEPLTRVVMVDRSDPGRTIVQLHWWD